MKISFKVKNIHKHAILGTYGRSPTYTTKIPWEIQHKSNVSISSGVWDIISLRIFIPIFELIQNS